MLNDEELKSQMTKYMLYQDSASRGAVLAQYKAAGKVTEEQLSPANILDLHTNQFRKRWLSRYKMSDISWLRCQFEDRGRN